MTEVNSTAQFQCADNIDVVLYQIEILVPQGTHSYIYSNRIPTDEYIKYNYGLFARIGNVSPLMYVIQHKQIVEKIHELL